MATNELGMRVQKQNNYFTSMLSKYNGNRDFISFLKPEQIQKSAKERIFREMARGQIDYSQYGEFYLDNKFIENLIVAANDELTNNQIVSAALYAYDMANPGDVNVVRVRTKHENLLAIFNVLTQRLGMVKMTGDIGYLTDIQYVLAFNAKNM